MCNLNINKSVEALEDANESVKLDSTYVKAYYRQAMALSHTNNYSKAQQALRAGLALKPDDKEMSTQLLKIEEKLKSQSAANVPKATNKVSVSHSNTSSTTPSPSSSTKASSVSKSTKESAPEATAEDEDEDLGNVRGYKKTSDGRTTTFFNREIDENTKALIGSIAPKKLEAEGEVILTGQQPNSTGSVWNSAGTYEEKNFTPWATDFLRDVLGKINHSFEGNSIASSIKSIFPTVSTVLLEVNSVEAISGHAQITMNRGKKKYVCDFTATLKWTLVLTFEDDKTPQKIVGQVDVLDITADREYEIENIQVTHLNESALSYYGLSKDLQNVINKFIKTSNEGIQSLILQQLNLFWNEFKQK